MAFKEVFNSETGNVHLVRSNAIEQRPQRRRRPVEVRTTSRKPNADEWLRRVFLREGQQRTAA
jgi:hypothetical protein